MNYFEYKISFNRYISEDANGLLMSDLVDMGFESFQEEDLTLLGYIKQEDMERYGEAISSYLSSVPDVVKVEKSEIIQQNWNALWESNFSPTIVNDRCVIRAPFHETHNVEYEIIIMPKMSFGTGHHQTTKMMMDDIFEIELEGKSGLDMGCGTGILGILAVMLGAKHMDIIDIDYWAYDNAIENVQRNQVEESITIKMGDASLLDGAKYDFVLANINRNILLDDMGRYVDVLRVGGTLTISGFLESDIPVLIEKAEELGLSCKKTMGNGKWSALRLLKK